jgi:hypothetical protein
MSQFQERDLRQCEAIVDGPTWIRTDPSGQCGRAGIRRDQLADVYLCWQHEQKAERYEELRLVSGRTLIVETKWSHDGWRRLVVGARVTNNVTHLTDRTKGS